MGRSELRWKYIFIAVECYTSFNFTGEKWQFLAVVVGNWCSIYNNGWIWCYFVLPSNLSSLLNTENMFRCGSSSLSKPVSVKTEKSNICKASSSLGL